MLQLVPAMTFLAGFFLLGERPTALGLLGAAVTLAGVSWGVRASQKS
jgi:drug/metabolite transporter (DMT)-like permease